MVETEQNVCCFAIGWAFVQSLRSFLIHFVRDFDCDFEQIWPKTKLFFLTAPARILSPLSLLVPPRAVAV